MYIKMLLAKDQRYERNDIIRQRKIARVSKDKRLTGELKSRNKILRNKLSKAKETIMIIQLGNLTIHVRQPGKLLTVKLEITQDINMKG